MHVMNFIIDMKLVGFFAYTGFLFWSTTATIGIYHICKIVIKGVTAK